MDTSVLFGFATFCIAIIGLVASIILARHKFEAQRRAEMAALARQNGLIFHEQDMLGLGAQLQKFDLFHREKSSWGRKGKVTNVMRGKVGDTDVYLFDYTYVISTGKSSRTISQTVFFADDKKWSLPDFRLKPENWWHKLMASVGLDKDINFADHPDFSEKFRLTGELDDLIRSKFSSEIREFLSAQPPAHLEGCNYYMIAYKPNRRPKPQEAQIFFDNCRRLTELLQQGGGPELLSLAEIKPPEHIEPVNLPDKEERNR